MKGAKSKAGADGICREIRRLVDPRRYNSLTLHIFNDGTLFLDAGEMTGCVQGADNIAELFERMAVSIRDERAGLRELRGHEPRPKAKQRAR